MSVLRIARSVLYTYLALILILGLLYTLLPPVSTLMLARWASFHGVDRDYVGLNGVNRNLLRAVVVAEDDAFCSHWGVDWRAMDKAVRDNFTPNRKSPTGGASTISMQVAKNLFLWPQRFYIRKIVEVPIAMYLDFIWSKSRMMEIYLSVAEWGDGVFGIEAASQKYFNKPAAKLTLNESALLVSALPNPRKRHPNKPSSYMRNYSQTIIKRTTQADVSCL